jgi:hypothetical protein
LHLVMTHEQIRPFLPHLWHRAPLREPRQMRKHPFWSFVQ